MSNTPYTHATLQSSRPAYRYLSALWSSMTPLPLLQKIPQTIFKESCRFTSAKASSPPRTGIVYRLFSTTSRHTLNASAITHICCLRTSDRNLSTSHHLTWPLGSPPDITRSTTKACALYMTSQTDQRVTVSEGSSTSNPFYPGLNIWVTSSRTKVSYIKISTV